jgi:hypothetical protein
MFYEIKGKPYVKAGGRYTEVTAKINADNKIIFVPTNHTLSMREVGRNYTFVSDDVLRDRFAKTLKAKSTKILK